MTPTTAVEIKINYSGSYAIDSLPEHSFTMCMEDAQEISSESWFLLFERVLAALGYCETSIMSGACSLAFNDLRGQDNMKKIAAEHDLALLEDPDLPRTVKVEPNKNPLNGDTLPKTLAKVFRVIADQIQTSGEDQFGVYENTGQDVREWLYAEAFKAETIWSLNNEP
jgi:hypothetical protein